MNFRYAESAVETGGCTQSGSVSLVLNESRPQHGSCLSI